MAKSCKGKTKRGTRCAVTRELSRDGLCLWHDPKRAEVALPYGNSSNGTVGRTIRIKLKELGDHEEVSNDHAHCQVKEKV